MIFPETSVRRSSAAPPSSAAAATGLTVSAPRPIAGNMTRYDLRFSFAIRIGFRVALDEAADGDLGGGGEPSLGFGGEAADADAAAGTRRGDTRRYG